MDGFYQDVSSKGIGKPEKNKKTKQQQQKGIGKPVQNNALEYWPRSSNFIR